MDDKTKEVLDAVFKFKLGEIVYYRSANDTIVGVGKPHGHVIVERRLHHCTGGIQQSYVIHGRNVQEIELTSQRPVPRKMTADEFEGFSMSEMSSRPLSWGPLPGLKEALEAKDDDAGT